MKELRTIVGAIGLCLCLFALGGCSSETVEFGTATTDEFAMDYCKFGAGDKTLVIIPGISVQSVMPSAEQVAAAYESLTEDFTIYVFDRRKDVPNPYPISEMAEDTVEAIKTIGLEHIYVMGASQGGMISIVMGIHHPELVEKMVVASTSANVTPEQFEVIDNWIELADKGDAEGLYLAFGEKVYTKEVFEQSRDVLVEAAKTVTKTELAQFVIKAESMRGYDVSRDLNKIQFPVLVIGDKDDNVFGMASTEMMESYTKDLPNFEIYVYEGYGHAVYDAAPDFQNRIKEFYLSK